MPEAVLRSHARAGDGIAGKDLQVRKAGVPEGCHHRLGHAAAAAHDDAGLAVKPVLVDQLGDGVVGFQKALVIDDGVDGFDRLRRRIDLVQEGHAAFLEGHRDGAATDAQRTHTLDGVLDVLGGEGLVDEVQPQLPVQVVVEGGAEVTGPPRQRHAQLGVLVDQHRVSSGLLL